MMIDLTIYGTPSASYEYAKTKVLTSAKKAGIQLNVEEVTDARKFINELIGSTPAFRIGEETRSKGKKSIEDFTEDVNTWILEQEQYGALKKFIVPVDFSTTSRNALQYATALAPNYDAMIQLLHLYYPTPINSGEYNYIDPNMENVRRTQFEELTKIYKSNLDHASIDKMIVDAQFQVGFPEEGILKHVQQMNNNMIVMGSTGEGAVLKRFFGSVSISVAQKSKSPVLIVPPNASFRPIKNIVYCANNLQLDAIVGHELIEFAKPHEAAIHIVHVGEDHVYEAENLLHLWRSFYPKSKITYTQIFDDEPLEEINEYCADNNIDLVAVGTEERGIFGNLFHSSMTKKMIINTEIPLLVLHRNDRAL